MNNLFKALALKWAIVFAIGYAAKRAAEKAS